MLSDEEIDDIENTPSHVVGCSMIQRLADQARRANQLQAEVTRLKDYIVRQCFRCGGIGCAECLYVIGQYDEKWPRDRA